MSMHKGASTPTETTSTAISLLRAQVLSLIKPYDVTDGPNHPLTTEELVVCAAIALGGKAITMKPVFHYICLHFRQYTAKALSDSQSCPTSDASRRTTSGIQ